MRASDESSVPDVHNLFGEGVTGLFDSIDGSAELQKPPEPHFATIDSSHQMWDDDTTLEELRFYQCANANRFVDPFLSNDSDISDVSSLSSSDDAECDSSDLERQAEIDGEKNSGDLVAPSDISGKTCFRHLKSKKLHLVEKTADGNTFFRCGHAEAAILRRLLFESYTLTATELRRKTDSSEADGPKKLPVQEIASRFEALEKKLAPIKVESVLEPSHGLINALAQCFEDGRLRYIEWSKCTSRALELNNVKEHGALKVWKADSSGVIKQSEGDQELKCDANSELEVLNALKRRGIAYELSKLMSFESHEKIISLLFTELQRDPIDGFRRPTMSQLAAADREIHLKLAELTRAGLPLGPSGELPLDKHIDKVLQMPSVMWLLMPKPKTTAAASAGAPAAAPPKKTINPAPKNQPKADKFNKTKIKKTKIPMPLQLRGGTPVDAEGKSICYGYNLGTCKDKGCKKGRHVCCKPGCFSASHTFLSHAE
eukprot:s612_g37.t1